MLKKDSAAALKNTKFNQVCSTDSDCRISGGYNYTCVSGKCQGTCSWDNTWLKSYGITDIDKFFANGKNSNYHPLQPLTEDYKNDYCSNNGENYWKVMNKSVDQRWFEYGKVEYILGNCSKDDTAGSYVKRDKTCCWGRNWRNAKGITSCTDAKNQKRTIPLNNPYYCNETNYNKVMGQNLGASGEWKAFSNIECNNLNTCSSVCPVRNDSRLSIAFGLLTYKDNTLYAFGGVDKSFMGAKYGVAYDPNYYMDLYVYKSNKWHLEEVKNKPTPGLGTYVEHNGDIYVFSLHDLYSSGTSWGVARKSINQNKVYKFSVSNKEWINRKDIPKDVLDYFNDVNNTLSGGAVSTWQSIIFWGNRYLPDGSTILSEGYKYNINTEEWTKISKLSAPSPRIDNTIVSLGSKVFIWGGIEFKSGKSSERRYTNDGKIYDVLNDKWESISNLNAPSRRRYAKGVSTGSEIIIWGGECADNMSLCSDSGYKYNLNEGKWYPISSIGAPKSRINHMAVWTGSEMIIWGGSDYYNTFDDGYAYNPKTDTWRKL